MSQPLNREDVQRRRVEQLLGECMTRQEIDLWLVYTRESSGDPIASDVGLGRVVARGAGIFHQNNGTLHRKALVASYDTTPVEESGIFEEVVAYRQEGISPHLKAAVEACNPQRIAINFSRDVPVADGLTYGMKKHLEEVLGSGFQDKIVSSEPLVVSFRARKLADELEAMRESVLMNQKAQAEVLTPDHIKPGKTREIDVAKYLEETLVGQGATVEFNMVMVGPCRGHADASERVIEPGDLLRIDFGAFHKGYCSDIQRTAYILKPGETEPPAAVQRLFATTLKACHAGISTLKQGARGRDVDNAARTVIVDGGYEEYPHATGHPIGLEAHELGPVLGPPWKERYGTSVEHAIEPGMIFAVEPAAYVDIPECGGVVQVGIEEDVIVTPDGPEIIGTPQTEIILIG